MSYLPLGYFRDFLEFVVRNRDSIEVLTYADLEWRDDWDYENDYPGELAAWEASLARTGSRNPRKAYLILQHDVDSAPARTFNVLRLEEEFGIRSNVMIFARWFDRKHLRNASEFRSTPYITDFAYLEKLQAKGFVIGYHCNAYERARFVRERAERIMIEDLEQLRGHFPVDFMSAHGGARGPDGQSNESLSLPPALRRNIRWIHNGHSISETDTYSDGGIVSGQRRAKAFDLRAFVQALRPGRRYRILTHPQYYDSRVTPLSGLDSAWYREVLAAYAGTRPRDAWAEMPAPRARRLDVVLWRKRMKRWMRDLSKR